MDGAANSANALSLEQPSISLLHGSTGLNSLGTQHTKREVVVIDHLEIIPVSTRGLAESPSPAFALASICSCAELSPTTEAAGQQTASMKDGGKL